MIDYILMPQSVEALGWTLVHSLWQGAAFAVLLVLILIALRSYTAQSRYVVSVGLLCAFFLTISATFWQQWQKANSRAEMAAANLDTDFMGETFVIGNSSVELLSPVIEGSNPAMMDGLTETSALSSWLTMFSDYFENHLPLLVTIWLLGLLFLQLRFLGRLAYVQRLKHYGTQLFPTDWSAKIEELEGKLRIRKSVRYLTSVRVASPMVIGWLKPVVLLPQQLFNSLTETEIYAVLAHELAHIRREDFVVNLLQTFLCNIFFFHPGVWWMSNRIDDEREHCCDDLAVAATGPATDYAKTLINVSEFQLNRQNKPALAMALSGKNKKRARGGFSDRIRRLFMAKNGAGSFREGFATAFILIAALFIGVIATGRTAQANESQTSNVIEEAALILDGESTMDVKMNPSTTIRTNIETRAEDQSIAQLNQIIDLGQLPVAKPAAPVAPVAPAQSFDTRIDALVMACAEGDLEFVKTLVDSGVDVNGIGSEGFSPLMMATSNDESQVVDYLIKKGANVNATYNGWTALIEAADEGALASMKLLLSAGAEVNYYGTFSSPSAITMAASEGHLTCLQLLLEHGADINGPGKSFPPLHIAAEEDKRKIIDFLIAKNVQINKKDVTGRTALMYAAAEGHKHAAVLLLDAGADKSIVDLMGNTPSDYAFDEKEYELAEFLAIEKTDGASQSESRGAHSDSRSNSSGYIDGMPKIHVATAKGHIEKVQRMVEQGTDVNTRDDYGRTALHIASAKNHNIDMRVLIDLGADLNAQDSQGRTPLMYAAADGKSDAVALLVSLRADVQIKDVDGMRAYEWGQSGGNPDLAKFLGLITEPEKLSNQEIRRSPAQQKKELKEAEKEQQLRIEKQVQKEVQKESEKSESVHMTEQGMHLRQFDIKRKTPELLAAARKGSIAECAQLLANGLSANAADDTGQTALMVASMTNQLDIAKFLIDEGADVNRSSASGLTALHYCALEDNHQIAQLLLMHNAEVDATMRYSSTDGNYGKEPLVWEFIGATPLLIAVESKNTKVLSVLIKAGADINHTLIKNEYRLNKNRESYLSASEVMGIDEDFLKDVKVRVSDSNWTPFKQAMHSNDPSILAFFPK